MEICIKNARRVNTDNSPYSKISCLFTGQLLKRFFRLITKTLEYVLGIHMGAVIGYLCGKCAGIIYIRYFDHINIVEINNIQQLWGTQYTFAIGGLLIGSIAGIIFIELTHKLQSPRKESK